MRWRRWEYRGGGGDEGGGEGLGSGGGVGGGVRVGAGGGGGVAWLRDQGSGSRIPILHLLKYLLKKSISFT